VKRDFDRIKFGSNLRYWRLKKGFPTIETLAEASGLSKSLIGQVERGGEFKLKSLAIITATLGITADDLMKDCLIEINEEE
jgi:transcriptional regulator with XRE-family HTH domain